MSRDPIYLFEQADFSVRLARCASDDLPLRIEELREISASEAAALMANLPSNVTVVCASRPKVSTLHLASVDEAKRHSGIAGVRKYVESSASSSEPAKWIAAVKARDGGEISDAPWLLSNSAEAQSVAMKVLEGAKPKSLRIVSAAIASAGALVGSAGRTVLLIDVGELASHAMLVGPEGVMAAGSIALDLARIGEAVQTELSLKFRGSAVKLFFNADYDFSEAGSKIAARLADAIKADLGRFMVDRPAPTELFVTGLPATQQWFGPQLANALGLVPHTPDLKAWCSASGLYFAAPEILSTLAPTWLTALHTLHSHTRANSPAIRPWQAEWIPVGAAVPVTVPVPASAAPVAPPTASPTKTVENVPTTKAASSVPAPVLPKKPATAASSPAKTPPPPSPVSASKPAATPVAPRPSTGVTDVVPTKSLIAAAAAKAPVSSTTTAPFDKPVKPSAPTPVSAAPITPKPVDPIVASVQTPPPPPPDSRPFFATPARSPKKKTPMLLIVGGIAACVIAGAFFYISSQSKLAAQLAQEKEHAELRLKSAAQKARLAELKAQEEAETRKKIEVEFTQKLVDSESARQRVETELAAQTAARLANARGSLMIVTHPAGATVTVGNLPPQISPATFTDIKIGSYPVTISLAHHEEVKLDLTVAENATTESGTIQLVAAVGSLRINCDPGDTQYELRPASALTIDPDARRTGQTPAAIDDLPPGDYHVTLNREGSASHSQVVSITRGATTHLRWSWPKGLVKIASNPPGATVLQAGKTLGVTPLTLTDQAPGSATYEVALDRYDTVLLVAQIEGGKTVELATEFKPEDRVFTIAEVDRKPDASGAKLPELPYYLKLEGGKVELQLTVKRDGSIKNLTVLNATNPELGKYCLTSVAKWQFKPGVKSGTPVNVSMKLPFVFKPSK